jgi:hypothetical protein
MKDRQARFYLALNRAGRGQLMGRRWNHRVATNDQWIDVMVRACDTRDEEDKLSVLVYYLTNNPTLIALLLNEQVTTPSSPPLNLISE